MEKIYRRLSFVEDDIKQILPAIHDYNVQIAMVNFYASLLELKHVIDLTKEFK